MAFSGILLAAVYFAVYETSIAQSPECSTNQVFQRVNDFGFQLVKEIGGEDNLFISPLSIYTALALVYLGSRGRTARQFEEALQTTSFDSRRFHEDFGTFVSGISSNNDEYRLSLANAIFLQEGFVLKRRYIDNATSFYGATLRNVNFLEQEVTRREINDWAANSTENMIHEFLKEPLDTNTVLALLNAIYFKGTWKIQFSPGLSYNGSFYRNDVPIKTVTYMIHHEEYFRYFADVETGFKFLELPYKGGHIAMLLALPISYDDDLDLEMTSSSLCRITKALAPKELETVMLPKFKLEYEKELKDALIELGMVNVFTELANLRGMSRTNILVSRVLHSAVIEVNEEGSEAAAITGAFAVPYSLNLNRLEFIANRPFLFYIIDQRSQIVLFSGRVVDPK